MIWSEQNSLDLDTTSLLTNPSIRLPFSVTTLASTAAGWWSYRFLADRSTGHKSLHGQNDARPGAISGQITNMNEKKVTFRSRLSGWETQNFALTNNTDKKSLNEIR